MLKKTSHRILTLVFGLGALRLLRKLYKLYRQKPLDPAGLEINSFEGRQRLADEFTELFKGVYGLFERPRCLGLTFEKDPKCRPA